MPSDVVRHFIAAIERNDLDHALNHLTDDVEYDNVPLGKVFGRDAVRATLGPFLAMCSAIDWEVTQQVAEGSLDNGVVMNERVDRFTIGAHRLELPVAGLFVVRHGQIALWRDYFDKVTFDQAMAAALG
jgi:limonene-1,2-epoxide hydrolase